MKVRHRASLVPGLISGDRAQFIVPPKQEFSRLIHALRIQILELGMTHVMIWIAVTVIINYCLCFCRTPTSSSGAPEHISTEEGAPRAADSLPGAAGPDPSAAGGFYGSSTEQNIHSHSVALPVWAPCSHKATVTKILCLSPSQAEFPL